MNAFYKVIRSSSVGFAAFLFIIGGFFVGIHQAKAATPGEVIINEFVSRPQNGDEWVELLNTTSSDISLVGWRLTDLTNPQSAPSEVDTLTLSVIIPAHGILVFDVGAAKLNDAGDSIGLYDNSATPNLVQRVTYGLISGYSATTGLESVPAVGQSAIFTSPSDWSVTNNPTKGWFNDAGHDGKAPLLSQIDGALAAPGSDVVSNIGELTNPSATPATEGMGALYFEKNGKGKIVFEKTLNLTNQATVAALKKLGSAIEMSARHIKFDSVTAAAMNSAGAKIYFYGLTSETQPTLIVKNDVGDLLSQDGIITNTSYTDSVGACGVGVPVCKTFSFNAAHFTQFDLQDKTEVYVDASKPNDNGDGLTAGTAKKTIQAGIDLVNPSGTVHVAPGEYTENPNISKNITLRGADGVKINGAITIFSDNVTVSGFDITNSSVGYGIISTDHSHITITNNTIHDIGSDSDYTSGSAQAIAVISGSSDVSDITVSDNHISNIGNSGMSHAGSAGSSAKGIYLGNSKGQNTISNVTISGNTLNNIHASGATWQGSPNYGGGAGAYGILVNHKTTGLQVTTNTIGTLEGLWVHAIGLESDTPNAVLNNNVISGLVSHKTPADTFAIYLEDNQSKNTVSLNSLVLGDTNNVVVDDDWTGYVNNPVVSVDGKNYIFGVNAFSNIQNGVNAAASDGTVNVASGVYNEENIIVNKALTLQGAGSSSTIVDASASASVGKRVFNINLTSGNVKLDGFKIKNGKQLDSIGANSTSSDSIITISHNEIQGFGNSDKDTDDFGLIAGYGSLAKVIVEHNTFNNTSSNSILFEKQVGETLVDDNTFTGIVPSIWYMTYGGVNVTTLQKVSNNKINLSEAIIPITSIGFASSSYYGTGRTGKYTNIEISSNSITGLKSFETKDAKAISVANEDADDGLNGEITAPKIINNSISGTGGIGINLVGYVTGADISGNTITGTRDGIKAWNGLYSGNFYPTGAIIKNNSLSGASSKVLNWLGATALDARNNWWGSAIKSDIQSKISGGVVFSPYYINEGKTTLSDLRSITSFTLPNQRGLTTINQEAGTVSLIMPYGTDIKTLKPSFEIVGQSLKIGDIAQISGETENDFTDPVVYKVYSIDGTTKDYTVTINILKNPAKSISAFTIGNQIGNTVINEATHSVTVTLPNNVNIVSLAPTIAITGASISPASGVIRDFTNPVTYTVIADDETATDYVVKVVSLTVAQTTPDENGQAIVNQATPEAIVVNPNQAITVAVSGGADVAKINVSSLVNGGTGVLPEITINSQNALNTKVSIPASTTVTSSDPNWNGIISTPKVVNVSLPTTSGQTKTLSTAIELGFSGGKLTFDKAVRILMPGQFGKRVGYIGSGVDFTEITTICTADNQTAGDALVAGGECKIDVGSDLVIWTKHFTSFATYTQTAATSNGGGGGGGGGGYWQPQASTRPADVNKDGKVNVLDFVSLMANWNKTGLNTIGDFNGDGKVDILDFVTLMADWTK